MRNICCFLLLITAFGCDKDSSNQNDIDSAMRRARVFCDASAAEMEWLRSLIIKSETNAELKGDVLAITLDSQPLFIHQPMIMSCLGCIIYTCSGTRVEPHTLGWENLREAMNKGQIIYRPT